MSATRPARVSVAAHTYLTGLAGDGESFAEVVDRLIAERDAFLPVPATAAEGPAPAPRALGCQHLFTVNSYCVDCGARDVGCGS